MESGHVFAERAQEIFLRLSGAAAQPEEHAAGAGAGASRCQAASLRRSTSAREHSFIHQADFTPRMAEIANGVDFRTMLAEGSFLLEGVDGHIIERLVFG